MIDRELLGKRAKKDLRERVYDKIVCLGIRSTGSMSMAGLTQVSMEGIEQLDLYYSSYADLGYRNAGGVLCPHCFACLYCGAGVGCVSSWYLSLVALAAYIVIGIVVPRISSKALKASGVKYRAEFSAFNAYFLDSIKGIKDIVLNNAGEPRKREVVRRSDILLDETRKIKHETAKAAAFTELAVSQINLDSVFYSRYCVAVPYPLLCFRGKDNKSVRLVFPFLPLFFSSGLAVAGIMVWIW